MTCIKRLFFLLWVFAAHAVAAAPATLTSPANGSTLAGSAQLFQWNDAGAGLYQLWVGSSPGAYDVGYYPPSGTTGTSVAVGNLPVDGRTLYVRLHSAIAGAWHFNDYVYTASSSGVPSPATITSPANGATLGGANQVFQWNAAPGATLYQVWVGNTAGAYDLGYFPPAGTSDTSTTVTGLPVDGRIIHVRLWSSIQGSYYFTDATYTAFTAPPIQAAAITSPTNGSMLSGASQLFQWTDAGAQLYQIWVGNALGGSDLGYFPDAGTTATSATATGLPTDGRTLYVRLWSLINDTYYFNDYTFSAAPTASGLAVMTSPASGTTLSGTTQLFQWTDAGAENYQLWVGSTPGAFDYGYYPDTGTTGLSTTLTGLPTHGGTLHVRLWTRIQGVWHYNDYTYTAATITCGFVGSVFLAGSYAGTLATTDCTAGARGGSYYADRYSFQAEPGQQVAFHLASSDFDTYLYLKNPAGTVIVSNDDGGGGLNSRIPPSSGTFTIPLGETGTYVIEVTSWSSGRTGSYTLQRLQ